jgi:hypothetical protein
MNTKNILTEEQIAQVEELAVYLNYEQIGDYLGFSEESFRNLKKNDPRVVQAYKQGRAKSIVAAARKLCALIEQGNEQAIIFYLETRGGWSREDREKDKVNISFEDTSPAGIFNSGMNALKEGAINLTQMEQLANLALMKMKIESNEVAKSGTSLLEQGNLYNMPKVKMN